MIPHGPILIVDDDAALRRSMQLVLEAEGLTVLEAASGHDALRLLRTQPAEVAFVDLKMPGMDGLALLAELARAAPTMQVIMLSAYATVERAVEAMRRGAHDVLTKPVHRRDIVRTALRALDRHRLEIENRQLRERMGEAEAFRRIVGTSAQVREILDLIRQVAPTDAPVLIEGETGTGKELVARAFHSHSRRSDGPFVAFNCGALPETLLEAELFGHEKGAFTGAQARRTGRFEAADGGSLFLDEIGELSPGGQVNLLRAIETGTFERLGSTAPLTVNVRVLAATNRDLAADVQTGDFRRDLFFRLNVVRLRIPPLRERREDIPVLAQHFLQIFAHRHERPGLTLAPGCLAALSAYDWPGNVRELENVTERAVVLARGSALEARDLPEPVRPTDGAAPSPAVGADADAYVIPFGLPANEIDAEIVRQTVARCGGDKAAAARALGVSTRTVYRRLQRLGASADDPTEPG